MKRHLLLFLLFACTTLGAQTNVYKVEDIPMVHLQDARRYVSNPDGILSETTVYAIDTTLYALERETGIQTLVVAVGQIEGGDCFDFAGHPSRHGRAVHPVCHGIWLGRRPPRRDMQADSGTLHESSFQ